MGSKKKAAVVVPTSLTDAQKREAYMRWNLGLNDAEIAKAMGVDKKLVTKWRKSTGKAEGIGIEATKTLDKKRKEKK